MYLGACKARVALEHPNRVQQSLQYVEHFRRELVQVNELVNTLETDVNALMDNLEVVVHEEESNNGVVYDAAMAEITRIRKALQNEIEYCRRRIRKHEYILGNSSMYAFYQTALLVSMEIIIGTRFVAGNFGPLKV